MTTRGTVLIAEDNVGLLRALTERLRSAGFTVIAVQDGYQALEQCRREKPDLMLMDINMPAGSGLSVQERMRSNPDLAAIPVIYMTGDHGDSMADRIEALGAAALVHKPVSGTEIIAIIEGVLAA
jgi:CheY-like chemotaxis protein